MGDVHKSACNKSNGNLDIDLERENGSLLCLPSWHALQKSLDKFLLKEINDLEAKTESAGSPGWPRQRCHRRRDEDGDDAAEDMDRARVGEREDGPGAVKG